MRRNCYIFLAICLFLISVLASCTPKSESKSPDGSKTSQPNANSDSNSTSNENISDLYFLKTSNTNDKVALLYYKDKNLNKEIVLCNKPNCKHDSTDCNAYFTSNISSAFLKSYNIYSFNNGLIIYAANKIYSINKDGTQRKLLYEIPDQYGIGQCEMYKDNLFFVISRYTAPNENNLDISITYEVLQFNLKDMTSKSLYSSKDENIGLIQGFADNEIYLYYLENLNQQLSDRTQEAYNNLRNNRNSRLIKINIASGNMTELINKKAVEFDSVKMIGNHLFYHSRKNSNIYKYNVNDSTSIVVGENISGYIEITEFYLDDYLVYYVLNEENYFFEPDKQKNDTCTLNTKNKKSTTIRYARNVNDKQSNIIITDVIDNKLYFDLDVEIIGDLKDSNGNIIGVRARRRQGCITKEDFWRGDYDKMELLDWIEFEELRKGVK